MTAFTDLVTAIGDARLGAAYHYTVNLTLSGSNFVSLGDWRGGGHGPDLVATPDGGTAPTVSGGNIVTNGVDSYIGNASPIAMLDQHNTNPWTLVWWGELLGTPTYWGQVVDRQTGGDLELLNRNGSLVQRFAGSYTSPKARPATGTRSLFILSIAAHYGFPSGGDPSVSGRLSFWDFVGRGPVIEAEGIKTANVDGLFSFGRYSTAYGSVSFRGALLIKDSLQANDRAAIEAFLAAIGDAVSLYDQPDSTGLILCLGDSRTYGSDGSAPSVTVPVSTSGSGWYSRLQSLINTTTALKVDVVNRGTASMTGIDAYTPQSGHTYSYVQDVCAMLSNARRLRGFPEIVIVGLGTNDIAGPAPPTPNITSMLASIIASVHAAGAKAVIWTIPPVTGFFGGSNESDRLTVNTWILANTGGADLVIDCRDAVDGTTHFFRDPGASDVVTDNATYYVQAVGIHFTDLANSRFGDLFFNRLVAKNFLLPGPQRSRLAQQSRAH